MRWHNNHNSSQMCKCFAVHLIQLTFPILISFPGGNQAAQQPAGMTSSSPGQDPNESVYSPANDGEMELHVGDPVLQKGSLTEHHVYPVVGRDSLGEIEC